MFWKRISSSIWGDGHPESHKTLALPSQNALPRAAHLYWPYAYIYIYIHITMPSRVQSNCHPQHLAQHRCLQKLQRLMLSDLKPIPQFLAAAVTSLPGAKQVWPGCSTKIHLNSLSHQKQRLNSMAIHLLFGLVACPSCLLASLCGFATLLPSGC